MCADIYMAGAGTKRRTGKSTKLRRLLCHRCSKSFKSVQTLTVHMGVCAYRNCEPRFKCTQCDKRFRTWLQFSRHVYYTHSDRSFTCTEVDCGRSFTSRSHLIAHHAIHTATRPYVCPFEGCTYRARTTGRLFQHKVIHGEGRRFSCDYCDYSATTSSNLRRHARIHAGARPYLCPHCDHRTSTLDALKKHVLDSGRHPGLPLYVCPWCSDTEIRDPGAPERFWSNCVGFNASGLAWRHLTAEHQDRIIKSARLKALGRSSDKILLERQLIHLHVGQAGVQTANALWELYCLEHQIQPDGRQVASAFDQLQYRMQAVRQSGRSGLNVEDLHGSQINTPGMDDDLRRILPVPGSGMNEAIKQARDFDNGAYETLFEVSPHGQFVPRAIFVDSEASVIDEVRAGMYRCLYHPQDLISHHEDCSNNFARGNITIGRKMIDKVMDRIRKAAEHCDLLQGFIATHSCSGGTGGGLTAYIFRILASDYEKYSIVQLPVYPSPQHSNAIVEPYNTVLHLDQAVDAVKLSTMMDNEAIGEVCQRNLMHRQPTFHTMNQVIALLTSSLISPVRYPGCLTAGLPELETNLVPFPRIHFPVLRHAPFMHYSRTEHHTPNIDQLVQNVFSSAGQTVKCDLNRGKFMACVLSFRGLVGPRLVNSALTRVKVTPHYDFVDWCPTGVKVNLVAQPPIFMAHDSHIAPTDCSVTMMANSTAIRSVWAMVGAKFDMMFSRRCFVHWFLNEGLEESELTEARETLASIEHDYQEIASAGDRNWNFAARSNLADVHKRGGWRFFKTDGTPTLSSLTGSLTQEASENFEERESASVVHQNHCFVDSNHMNCAVDRTWKPFKSGLKRMMVVK